MFLFCVWCLDNWSWSRILSGKPFNTFSMARLKILQFHLILTSPFHCHAYIICSLFHHFFQDLWLGYLVYSRVTLDLWLILIHRDLWNSQKWQILISVNRDFHFFFINWVLGPEISIEPGIRDLFLNSLMCSLTFVLTRLGLVELRKWQYKRSWWRHF